MCPSKEIRRAVTRRRAGTTLLLGSCHAPARAYARREI
jgi:hypothetical protein